jgi:hypothetical protein
MTHRIGPTNTYGLGGLAPDFIFNTTLAEMIHPPWVIAQGGANNVPPRFFALRGRTSVVGHEQDRAFSPMPDATELWSVCGFGTPLCLCSRSAKQRLALREVNHVPIAASDSRPSYPPFGPLARGFRACVFAAAEKRSAVESASLRQAGSRAAARPSGGGAWRRGDRHRRRRPVRVRVAFSPETAHHKPLARSRRFPRPLSFT